MADLGGKRPGFLPYLVRSLLLLLLLAPATISAFAETEPSPAVFGAGSGVRFANGVFRLLDDQGTFGQANAIGFEVARDGSFERFSLNCRLRVLAGGDGGALIFLNTSAYGRRGPAPFLKSWVEPNLAGSFAVAIDVHDPPSDDPYGPWGNYQGRPERAVSLHWDGREIVKRVAPVEFRGEFVPCAIEVRFVVGGAEVSVWLAGAAVFQDYFVPGMQPYEMRLAFGAGTRSDAATAFDVAAPVFAQEHPAGPQRAATHIELFNHVFLSGAHPSREQTIQLPPARWAYGRVVLTLELHDAGPDWDSWDRTGHLFVTDAAGTKHDIAPFVTSFQTPCFWQLDVTHFRPWLAGEVTFEITVASGDDARRGFQLSAALDFYHGVPQPAPFQVVPLWEGTARYSSAERPFGDFFVPRKVAVPPEVRAAQLFVATSGHTPVGEFTPSRRTLVVAPEGGSEQRFTSLLWNSDNDLNPHRPQFGTWKYARAGWAPGDLVRPWRVDLTPLLVPGGTVEFRYQPEPYDFSDRPSQQRPSPEQVSDAVHQVRAYLVLYRSPDGLRPAPPLRVLDVETGSNAARAGVREGDCLESYDGRRPASIGELREFIEAAANSGKERVVLVVSRAEREFELDLDPGRLGVRLEEL